MMWNPFVNIVANGMKDDESEIAFPAWITRILEPHIAGF
jgi:hypothetical protein